MKKRKKLFFYLFLLILVVLTGWLLTEPVMAGATTGQITVNGRIGEKISKEKEESDDNTKETIVINTSQIAKGNLPRTDSSIAYHWMVYGYIILLLFFIILIKKARSFLKL